LGGEESGTGSGVPGEEEGEVDEEEDAEEDTLVLLALGASGWLLGESWEARLFRLGTRCGCWF